MCAGHVILCRASSHLIAASSISKGERSAFCLPVIEELKLKYKELKLQKFATLVQSMTTEINQNLVCIYSE